MPLGNYLPTPHRVRCGLSRVLAQRHHCSQLLSAGPPSQHDQSGQVIQSEPTGAPRRGRSVFGLVGDGWCGVPGPAAAAAGVPSRCVCAVTTDALVATLGCLYRLLLQPTPAGTGKTHPSTGPAPLADNAPCRVLAHNATPCHALTDNTPSEGLADNSPCGH